MDYKTIRYSRVVNAVFKYFGDIKIVNLTTKFKKITLDFDNATYILKEHDALFQLLFKKIELFFEENPGGYIVGMDFPNEGEYIFPKDCYKYPIRKKEEWLNIKDAEIFNMRVENAYQTINLLKSSTKIKKLLKEFLDNSDFYNAFSNNATSPKLVFRKWYDFKSKDKWILTIKKTGWAVSHKYKLFNEENVKELFRRFLNYIDVEKYYDKHLEICIHNNIFFITKIF